ncbi:MAG: hypothetical protein ACYTFV_18225 [Planctomycetota bacterium]
MTSTAGRVAPQEVAATLAAGDFKLALGLGVSLALALVWLGSVIKDGARAWAPRLALVAGLLFAVSGSIHLQVLNRSLADDYRSTVVSSSTLSETEALASADAYYGTTYVDARPVHSSTQLAGLIDGGGADFEKASKARSFGLLLAIVAFTVSAGSRRKSCRTAANPS